MSYVATGTSFGGVPVYTSTDANYTYTTGYVPVTKEVIDDDHDSILAKALQKQMERMAGKINENIYTQSPLLGAIQKKKESTMSDTEAAVAKARAEAKEAKAKQLLEHVESEIGQYELVAGTFITARVEFADSDKIYQYAWIKGDKSWYRTYSTRTYTTEQVVDELVRLVLDANSVEWEIVGTEQ